MHRGRLSGAMRFHDCQDVAALLGDMPIYADHASWCESRLEIEARQPCPNRKLKNVGFT